MSYGCGASGCLTCYPFWYSCEACGTGFAELVANGSVVVCTVCGYDQHDVDTVDFQIANAAR